MSSITCRFSASGCWSGSAFDPREERPLGRGLREGGLPWWGRHTYAMGTRLALVPAAAVLWLAPGTAT